jgi:hypothetical protein
LSSDVLEEEFVFIGIDELDRRSLFLLYFVVGKVSLSLDLRYFVSLVVSEEVTEDDE